MNKFQKLSFGLVAVLAVGAFVALAQELPEEPPKTIVEGVDSRPIVEVEVDGKKFSAPVNENIQVSEARRNFDRHTIKNLFGKLAEMVSLIVMERASHFRVAKVALGIIPQAIENSKKMRKLQKTDTTPAMGHGYANKMGDLITDITQVRTDERIDAVEAKTRTDSLMEAIGKMTEVSSTGLYLDWTKFSIDGQPLTHYVAPVLQWLRDNGYSFEIKILDKLAGVVRSLSTSGKKQ